MGVTQLVKGAVSLNHFGHNPGVFPVFCSDGCASGDDFSESPVYCDGDIAVSNISLQPFGDSEFIRKKDESR